MWPNTDCWMNTLDDVVTTSLLRVHMIVAAGRLPPWMQERMRVAPWATVWLSGLVRNESRMTTEGERDRT